MEKIHENMHVLRFHVNLKPESTKTCCHVNFPFSAYYYPSLHHHGKGSITYLRTRLACIIPEQHHN